MSGFIPYVNFVSMYFNLFAFFFLFSFLFSLLGQCLVMVVICKIEPLN